MIKKYLKKQGFGLIEIVIGASIITVGILGIISTYNIYINYAINNKTDIETTYILEEGIEAVTFLRDGGWSASIAPLSGAGTQYLFWNGSTWATSTTPEYVDGKFLRSFTINPVNRDSNDLISSSGTNDTNTKLLTVSVSFWKTNATSTKTLSTYITNLNND